MQYLIYELNIPNLVLCVLVQCDEGEGKWINELSAVNVCEQQEEITEGEKLQEDK